MCSLSKLKMQTDTFETLLSRLAFPCSTLWDCSSHESLCLSTLNKGLSKRPSSESGYITNHLSLRKKSLIYQTEKQVKDKVERFVGVIKTGLFIH